MLEQTEKKNRYDAIDGLRAFAAIGIVLMHVLSNGQYNLGGFIFKQMIPSFTNLVFLFMIISGFAMCCGYYDKVINNQISIEKFYKKRYARIWPYFAMLCVLDLMISPSWNALYEMFANLTLCFGLLPDAGSITVIGVGWFLGLSFVFYLVFPFFCFLLMHKRRAWVSFGVAFIFNFLCTAYFDVGRFNIIYSAVFFLGGGLIYLYKDSLAMLAEKYRWMIFMLSVGLAILYYLIGKYVVIMLLLCAVLLIYSLGIHQEGILLNQITKFVSSISMEIYLCHMVIYRVIEKVGWTHLFVSDILSYIVTAVGTIAGAIGFAWITQWGIKKSPNCYGEG